MKTDHSLSVGSSTPNKRIKASRGKLIVSFDCEGKWGIADRPQHRLDEITGPRLRNAYSQILGVLKRYEVKATFGIVAALCLDRNMLKDRLHATAPLLFCGQDWLGPVRQSAQTGNYDGWSHPELAGMIMEAGGHELCSHGGFHLPYDPARTPETAIDADVAVVLDVQEQLHAQFCNFIYPRNVIGYQDKLVKAGFKGYRDIDPREMIGGAIGKLQRVAHEYMSGDLDDMQSICGTDPDIGLVPLSSGKFFNARIGIRKLVPNAMTVHRIGKFIEHAAHNNLIAHFYSHPHNFISDPAMLHKLNLIMGIASTYRDKGLIDVITMKDEFHERCAIPSSHSN